MFIGELYPFQRRGAVKIIDGMQGPLRGYLLCDEMGLGKSVSALYVMCKMQEEGLINRALIVAPVVGLGEWSRMIRQFTDESYITVYDKKDLHNSRAFFTVVGFDRYRLSHAELDKSDFDMIVVDEFHHMKNPQAKRTKAILSHRYPYALLMTGTPILNHTHELWAALHYLESSEFPSFKRFYNRYTRYYNIPIRIKPRKSSTGASKPHRGYTINVKKPYGVKNVSELKGKLRGMMVRRLKRKVCAELPPKAYQKMEVKLAGEQDRHYKRMLRELRVEIGKKKVSAANVMAQFVRLRQICEGLFTISDNTDSAKVKLLATLLDDIIYGTHKAIVFTSFVETAKHIHKKFRKFSPVLSVGNMKAEEAVQRFQGDKKCKLFVGTIDKNYQAITLTKADYVIFIGCSLVPKKNEQAEDRACRIGQDRNVTIIYVVAKDTVDDRVQEIMAEKSELFDEIFGDGSASLTVKSIGQLIGNGKGK